MRLSSRSESGRVPSLLKSGPIMLQIFPSGVLLRSSPLAKLRQVTIKTRLRNDIRPRKYQKTNFPEQGPSFRFHVCFSFEPPPLVKGVFQHPIPSTWALLLCWQVTTSPVRGVFLVANESHAPNRKHPHNPRFKSSPVPSRGACAYPFYTPLG